MTKLEKERTEEINALIKEMTLEEKVSLMLHESMAVPRLGIPEYNWWNEGLHGVARNGAATVFPQTIGLAATWDTDLAKKEYSVISDEARAKYNESVKKGNRGQFAGLTFWTPNINIVRDPRWGRAQETFGEDPYLTSQMGIAAVKGLQGDDPENLKTAACAKHFAVHSGPEAGRHVDNIKPSKKDLWETYLPAFKALVDNGVESVMGAYQRLYDEPCNGSKFLLKEVLREKWGFKGHVVSDCWAVRDFHENHKVTKTPAESAALAIENTCDLNCGCTYHAAIDAVRQGILSEEKINESVFRLLMTRFKLGMFDNPKKSPWAHLGYKDVDTAENRKLACKVAEESIVLLKNKNNLLPLNSKKKKIQIIGPTATNVDALLGNYYGLNGKMVTILEGLTEKMKEMPELAIDYHMGCGMYATSKQRGWTLGTCESADVVIACFGLDGMMEGEEGDSVETTKGDRDFIELPPWQLDYLKAVHDRGTPVILVLTNGAAVAFPEDIADAILEVWYPGEEGGTAVANVIFGDRNPSGHLPVTFPKSTKDLPPFADYKMKGHTYKYSKKEPLFPFGFGLSYTTFKFDSMELENCAAKEGKPDSWSITASCNVTNTGTKDGKEVVQLYISKNEQKPDDPLCTLKRFKKIALKKGESKNVSFKLTAKDFESIDKNGESVLIPGDYTIIISDSVPTSRSVELGASTPVKVTVRI
ncbi:MAG: glycoside hydrolase family 3 C-terminal domain-containing protein [Treponema sp.]|nr:glycoside hydrolase family 3 C-terminal domain-containing protein [Treponema sp.]